jgi:hypothetical protein
MSTSTFWRDSVERAVTTFCQSLVAVLGAGSVGRLNVAWVTSLSTAGLAAPLSLSTSLGSAPLGKRGEATCRRSSTSPPPSRRRPIGGWEDQLP